MNNYFLSAIGSIVTVTYSFEICGGDGTSIIQELVKTNFADNHNNKNHALKWSINLDSLTLDSGNSDKQILSIKIKFFTNSQINQVDMESVIKNKADEVKIKIQSIVKGTYKSSEVFIDASRERDTRYLISIFTGIAFTAIFWYIVTPRNFWNNWVALMLFSFLIIAWIYISAKNKRNKIWSDNSIYRWLKMGKILWLIVWRFAISAFFFWLVVSNYPVNISINSMTAPTVVDTAPSGVVATSALSSKRVLSTTVPFSAANGTGTIIVSGDDSPVAVWFSSQPGEVSLDLVDADVTDTVSVVEELVSFWFFQNDDRGGVPPNIFESAIGDITDSVGTRYVVEAELLPPVPVAETTATSSTSTSTTTSTVPPETSKTPTTTSTIATSISPAPVKTPATMTTPSLVTLQVQVLNVSGIAGVAVRMADKLAEVEYINLPSSKAPQRYSFSVVNFFEGWQDEVEEILQAGNMDEIDQPISMSQQFASKKF